MQTSLMFSIDHKMLSNAPQGFPFCKLCSLQSSRNYCSLCCLPLTTHVQSDTPRSSSTMHPSCPHSERSALCCLVFYHSTPATSFLHVLTLKGLHRVVVLFFTTALQTYRFFLLLACDHAPRLLSSTHAWLRHRVHIAQAASAKTTHQPPAHT